MSSPLKHNIKTLYDYIQISMSMHTIKNDQGGFDSFTQVEHFLNPIQQE